MAEDDTTPSLDAACVTEIQDAADRLADCGALDAARRLAWAAAGLITDSEDDPPAR